jgi:hypothetical protein
MVRRVLLSSAILLAACAMDGSAHAQAIEAPRRYTVATTLPTYHAPPPRLDSDDPHLLVRALGLDMRSLWLSPGVELSFAQGTKLVALDVTGWGNVTFTPTSFGGGTLTLSAPF